MTVVCALTWLGQSTALAALTAAFVRLPGLRQSAAARYVAWASTLFLCAGLLAVSLKPAAAAATPLGFAPVAASARPAGSIPLVVLPTAVTLMSGWLGWIWAVGAGAGLTAAVRDVRRVIRLKRQAVPFSMEERARLGAGLDAWKSGRAPRLAWTDALDCPSFLGFSHPVIALPRSQAASLSAPQSRLIVLHELAHVRRRDDWWALAERVALALTWVNPAVHWVGRELSLSREMACDEWVVRQTAAPVAYAKCLADVAGRRTRARRLPLAAGVTGRAGTVRRRIVSVLALDGRPSARAAAIVAWLAPVAVCAAAAGLVTLPPVFVVSHPPDAAAAAWPAVPHIAAGVHAGRPFTRLEAAGQAAGARRVPATRGAHDAPAIQAEPAVFLESLSPAPAVPDTAAEQAGDAGALPIAASPFPGAGEPGVTAAPAVSGTLAFQGGASRWWSGPAAIGEATGSAAAAAGRATGSFFTRVGTHVPQLLKR